MAKVKPLPLATDDFKETPKETELLKEIPEASELNKEQPKILNQENVVILGGKEIEIKPTKIKYQRNKTAMSYRILQLYPLTDVLSMDKGIIDKDRDGDQIVFDFLVAVFDDPELVSTFYDDMNSEDIDRILKIFCRLNHISEKEEALKNRETKETKR